MKYPFIDDQRKLSDNYKQVVKIAESEERKLAKENLTEQANKLFDKMLMLGLLLICPRLRWICGRDLCII